MRRMTSSICFVERASCECGRAYESGRRYQCGRIYECRRIHAPRQSGLSPTAPRRQASHVTVPSATPGQDRLEPGGVVNAQAVPQPRRTQAGVPTGYVKVALVAPTFQRELRSHAAQPRQQLATNRSSERDGSLMFILVHCGVQHDRRSGTARPVVKTQRISAIVNTQTHG